MHERILTLATSIAAPSQAEEALLAALCSAAEDALEKRLRDGVAKEDCSEPFLCASALLAVAGLLPCREAYGGVKQFSAGDVSIQLSGSKGSAAGLLRQQAAQLMAAYLDNGAFAFLGVNG